MTNALSVAEDLAAAGVERSQARARAEAIALAVGRQRERIAAKDFARSEINAAKFGTSIAIAALSVTVPGFWIGP